MVINCNALSMKAFDLKTKYQASIFDIYWLFCSASGYSIVSVRNEIFDIFNVEYWAIENLKHFFQDFLTLQLLVLEESVLTQNYGVNIYIILRKLKKNEKLHNFNCLFKE